MLFRWKPVPKLLSVCLQQGSGCVMMWRWLSAFMFFVSVCESICRKLTVSMTYIFEYKLCFINVSSWWLTVKKINGLQTYLWCSVLNSYGQRWRNGNSSFVFHFFFLQFPVGNLIFEVNLFFYDIFLGKQPYQDIIILQRFGDWLCPRNAEIF